MKILVCIKQVLDSESSPQIDDEGTWINDDASLAYRMNRFDEYALEEAVLIKESRTDVHIEAISVGPGRVRASLQKALEKGADSATHISREAGGSLTPYEVGSLIAEYAKDGGYDLICTGVMAEDDMYCQTGVIIASLLSLPCATSVTKESLDKDLKNIIVECDVASGVREEVSLTLPALLTIQTGINNPRYPSLSNVLRAKKQKLNTISDETVSPVKSREQILKLFATEQTRNGEVISGTTEEKAEKLLSLLYEKALL